MYLPSLVQRNYIYICLTINMALRQFSAPYLNFGFLKPPSHLEPDMCGDFLLFFVYFLFFYPV